ncbi:MAG: Flp pilus assembly complex ATPase component TadA, partial [Nevskia sp.]|nr:Flp pilus assembly complex ATPase component TadA [Nevskia sp.]
QREVEYDTHSFPNAIRGSLRQDPDVILIGEMRGSESMIEALRAAATGHLVISTMHTNDAVQSINRVVNAFPPHEQEGIRRQMANVLQGAVAQRLVPHSCGIGRVLAMDILVRTAIVRDYIDRNKLNEIYQIIQEGAIDGMQSMNQSLMFLFRRGDITREAALEYSDTPKELEQMMAGVAKGGTGTVY